MENKSIIITGGAGFIGVHLAKRLYKKGYQIKIIDNLSVTEKNLKELKKISKDIIVEDVSEYSKILPAFENVYGVIHLAAMNRAQRSVDDPLAANKANITGTLSVLECCRKAGVKKFVGISSSSVYGNSTKYPRDEADPTLPPHPYGVGKLAGEHYTRVYGELFGFSTSIVRLFSVYGPKQMPDIEYAAVIPKFIHKSLNNEPIEVFGDGTQKRSFTYVLDAVDGIIAVFEKSKGKGEIYNISSPQEISILELVKEIEKITGQKASLNHEPLPDGDPKKNTVSIEKAKNELGFIAQTSLTNGLQKTLEWLKEYNSS